MATLLRSALTAAMLVGVALIGLVLARPAGAVPRCAADCSTLSVNPARPAAGTALTVTGEDFGSRDRVEFTLHGATNPLGSAQTNAGGAFRTRLTLPSDLAGRRPIVASDPSTDQQVGHRLTIGARNAGVVGRAENGVERPSAYARVALIGLGAVGVVLLTGGGLLLLTARREHIGF